MESAPSRRACLEESKHFLCTCERCMSKKDLSRGFVCPWCKVGTVFPTTNASSKTIHEWATDCAQRGIAPRNKLFGCNKCDLFDPVQDFRELEKLEKALEKEFRRWEGEVEAGNAQFGRSSGTMKVGISCGGEKLLHSRIF